MPVLSTGPTGQVELDDLHKPYTNNEYMSNRQQAAQTTRKEPNFNATLRYSRAIYHHRLDMTIIKQNSGDHSSSYSIDEWSLFIFFNGFAP
jgi:hypothetical protein